MFITFLWWNLLKMNSIVFRQRKNVVSIFQICLKSVSVRKQRRRETDRVRMRSVCKWSKEEEKDWEDEEERGWKEAVEVSKVGRRAGTSANQSQAGWQARPMRSRDKLERKCSCIDWSWSSARAGLDNRSSLDWRHFGRFSAKDNVCSQLSFLIFCFKIWPLQSRLLKDLKLGDRMYSYATSWLFCLCVVSFYDADSASTAACPAAV